MIRRMLAGIVFAARCCRPSGSSPGRHLHYKVRLPLPGRAIDLTGDWDHATEDWRREWSAAKGDFASAPTMPRCVWWAKPGTRQGRGRRRACKAGAGIMRMPGRLHVTWEDDNTLKVEFDAGRQTRLLHFGAWTAPGGEATWQGDSVAEWVTPPRGRGGPPGGAPPGGGAGGPGAAGPPRRGLAI
jgi:hypothetical protein